MPDDHLNYMRRVGEIEFAAEQARAHLVTHEHGRAVDTHLHEPAPARGPRDLPVPTMPITSSDLEPDSWSQIGAKWSTLRHIFWGALCVALAVFVTTALMPGGFIFN